MSMYLQRHDSGILDWFNKSQTKLLFNLYGRRVTRFSLEPEVWVSNLGPVKSNSVANAGHRCDISSKEAVFSGCNDVEMGPANSLHASA